MKMSPKILGVSMLMVSLALTAYLASVAVRASPPPPLTFTYQNSTFGGPVARLVCSPTNGGDVQVLSQNVVIGSGHTGYILPQYLVEPSMSPPRPIQPTPWNS